MFEFILLSIFLVCLSLVGVFLSNCVCLSNLKNLLFRKKEEIRDIGCKNCIEQRVDKETEPAPESELFYKKDNRHSSGENKSLHIGMLGHA